MPEFAIQLIAPWRISPLETADTGASTAGHGLATDDWLVAIQVRKALLGGRPFLCVVCIGESVQFKHTHRPPSDNPPLEPSDSVPRAEARGEVLAHRSRFWKSSTSPLARS
jgi:hypothetical protein